MTDLEVVIFFIISAMADFCFADALFSRYHPVIGIGRLISRLEKYLYPTQENKRKEFFCGLLITVLVVLISYSVVKGVLFISSLLGWIFFYPLFLYLVYSAVACGGLAREANNVLKILQKSGLVEARIALSRIVGRETETLGEGDIYRAVIETVAENFSDGFVAPLFYLALGGLPLAWAYKAINTLDSMLGYKDRRYLYFGRSAAYLDDIANFIPARLAAVIIIIAGFFQGLDWRFGMLILKRDRLAHASPNGGHPEAAMAGILGVRIGGDNRYHGQLINKPFIGDSREEASRLHVLRAISNLYLGSSVIVVIMVLILI